MIITIYTMSELGNNINDDVYYNVVNFFDSFLSFIHNTNNIIGINGKQTQLSSRSFRTQ